MTNRDLFAKDPTATNIPNDGVAKVVRPETDYQWDVLEWELKSFICEGEYKRGLERILDSFVTNLTQAQQPAVWVSGFYGSGKSHLCRVLEYLWRDVELPSGRSARSVVSLPTEIDAHFRELSTWGKRNGGLWSAAGTLGSGRSQAVRLAFLSILFDAAGLPQSYPLARFTIWAKDNGCLDAVKAAVETAGKSFDHEVQSLYVSPIIAKALLEADPTLGETVQDVRGLLKAQFPARTEDISDDEMFEAVEDVLRLQSSSEGKYPLTLVVLDEMQQYLGDDTTKTLAVQNIVEGVSSRFDNSVLFLATGQSAMGGTPTLQKLTDRFPVHVHLSDTDVETVVREVILRKKPDRRDDLAGALGQVSGEIDRHLGGTKISPKAEDKKHLVADYPLLPTRRRFWELALKALDKAGKAGVLRTQLRIVHEATRAVADQPVGCVVGADFLYDQQAPTLQQSGDLLKEISESILALKAEGPDGELKSRICALVFLINEIPDQVMGAGHTGLRATAPYIADLLIEDLANEGPQLRKRVPELLEALTGAGRLMRIDDVYRLQTEEGSEWEKEYRRRLSAIRDDSAKLATLRNERLYRAVDEALGGLRLTQGKSKAPRNLAIHFGADEPSSGDADIPVWIRDEWSVTESTVRNAASQAGESDPVVHVLLPKRDAHAIKEALASHAAAQETVQAKPTPQTDEGRQAQAAMKGRVDASEQKLNDLFSGIIANASVYQGGGNQLTVSGTRVAVETAARRSLVRLFPKFDVADHAHWGTVVTKAREGAPDALKAVGYEGEVPAHPVCKEVLASISAAGSKGAETSTQFSGPPFGWAKDAINGALMALLASGHIRAARDGVNLTGPKQLEPRQIGKVAFYKEDEPPSTSQRLAVRGLLSTAEVPYENGQEQAQLSALLQKMIDLAGASGGEPPLPERPGTTHVEALQAMAGNQQFRQVADEARQLKTDLTSWRDLSQRKEDRRGEWAVLEALLHHARDLEGVGEIAEQREAVRSGRQLLEDPNSVRPLIDDVIALLRPAVMTAAEDLKVRYDEVVADLRETDQWDQLDENARAEVMAQADLRPPIDIDVSTHEQLLAVLNDAPLDGWADKSEVLRARATRVRELAAKRLEPEAVRVTLMSATLKSADDVDAYLSAARQQILQHIDSDRTVII